MGMKMKEKLMALPGQHHLTNYEEVAESHNGQIRKRHLVGAKQV